MTIDTDYDIFDRTWEMVMEWRQAHPEHHPHTFGWVAFPFGHPSATRLRWRMSPDVRMECRIAFDANLAHHEWVEGAVYRETLYGLVLAVDVDLPPNSVILEPMGASE